MEQGGVCGAEPLAQVAEDFIDQLREKTNPEVFIQALHGAELVGAVSAGEEETVKLRRRQGRVGQ